MSQPLYIPFYQKDAAAGDTNTRYLVLNDDYTLEGVQLINNGQNLKHGTNNLSISIAGNDGATAAFTLTTDSGESDAQDIPDAGTVNFVDEKTGLANFVAGTKIKLTITKANNGKSLDCAIVLKLMPARSYA